MQSDDPDPDTANIFPQILLIVVLTAINAFFAASELAVVSANKNKIKRLAQEGNKKAMKVEKLAEDETKFLSTIQVGITLAGFFSSATASVTLSEGFGVWLGSIGVPYGEKIAMVIITLVLSYITLIFGELFPKRIALRDPEKISMNNAGVLLAVRFVVTPFVKLLSSSCELLVKLFGMDNDDNQEKVSDEDIIDVVTEGVSDGSIGEDKQKIIEAALKFYHLNAADLMTPRVDVFMIDIDDDTAANVSSILSEKYTRVPVYKNTIDNIIGVINAKDILLSAYETGFENVQLEKIMRQPFFAQEFIDADQLFEEMRKANQQIAFLVDEYGGFSGLVTMEDLVEEIVGNIEDEYDEKTQPISFDGDICIADGSVAIHELNAALDISLDDDNPEYDTVGGLIVYETGHIPENGENVEITVDNVMIRVISVDNNRVSKVGIRVLPKEDEEKN